MKPIITLGETKLADGKPLELSQRDDTFYLRVGGAPVLGSDEDHALTEAAELVCSPVRSAKQPKMLIAPIGLGAMSGAICNTLTQKKGQFLACDMVGGLSEWIKKQDSLRERAGLNDARLVVTQAPLLDTIRSQEWSGIVINHDLLDLIDPDLAADMISQSGLQRMSDSLMKGSLLVIVARELKPRFQKIADRVGFEVTRERIPMSLKARKARLQNVYLLKKGSYVSSARG